MSGWRSLGGGLERIGTAPAEEAHANALAAASKALEIDDSLAEVHWAMAELRAQEWDWGAAEKEDKKAFQLNPGYALAHVSYSNQLRHLGHFEESIAEAKRAEALDPISPMTNEVLGNAYLSARQYGLAIEQYQKTLHLDPNRSASHDFLGKAYFYSGMYDKGIEEIQKRLALDGESSNLSPDLAYIYSVLGRKGEARKILQRLLTLSKQVQPGLIALIYIGLGENDEALVWLEKAYQQHSDMMTWLKIDPRFDSVRADPRFQDLMRRVGLIR
jgi:tetratricopeptide (TPR) repeat protein